MAKSKENTTYVNGIFTDTDVAMSGFGELAPLESFDCKAFISDDVGEQKVCSFVLTLALIYNDLKNYVWALSQMGRTRPAIKRISRLNGQHAGIELHLNRLFYAHIRALYDVINNNQDLLKHPLFEKTISSLDQDLRKLWASLVSVSTDDKIVGVDKNTKRILEQIRHKSISHYDIAEIERGYKDFFHNNPMRAYISHGKTMGKTRFYFADAAIDGYLNGKMQAGIEEIIANIVAAATAVLPLPTSPSRSRAIA